MKAVCWMCAAVLGLLLVAPLALALDITLDAGGGNSLTIVDNDGNDLNPATGTIDFATTVGGIFDADGRVFENLGPLRNRVTITSRTIGGEGVFRNLDSASHAFVVRVNSSPFATTGMPLGWRLFYTGSADDPSPDDVEIPTNDVSLSTDGPTLRAMVSAPVPLTAPGSQPAVFDTLDRAVDASGQATVIQLEWNLAPGARDEIRLPDNNDLEGLAIQAAVFNEIDDCIFVMNRLARQAQAGAGGIDLKCIKTAFRAGGGDVTACVDNPADARTVRQEERLIERYPIVCPIPAAFGVNEDSCCHGGTNAGNPCSDDGDCGGGSCATGACISAAGERAANGAVHDLFGATVNISGGIVGKCHKAISQLAHALQKVRSRVFLGCKEANLTTISDEAGLVSTCLGPPQPDDADTSIALKTARIAATVQRVCVDKGVTPVGGVFPGVCTAESDGTFADCVSRHVACRFCRHFQSADDLGSSLDCDLFDDGVANSSCP